MRSYYSVGRPPAKFRRIWSSFDSPTVKHIVVPLPVPSSDVSVSETVAGSHLYLSSQPANGRTEPIICSGTVADFSSDVSVSETAAGLHFSSLPSAQAISSQLTNLSQACLTSPSFGSVGSRSEGFESPQFPLT